MDRREAISSVAFLLGGTIIGADLFISGCALPGNEKVETLFDKPHVAFMNEIGDTILPTTNTPGAKAANVGYFMAVMVRDCYEPANQQIFIKGLAKIDDAAKDKFGKKFIDCNSTQRSKALASIDQEEKAYTKTKKDQDPNHYFRMMKELTILGYFTSEIGYKQARRYLPVPGKFEGDIPYTKGDRAWAIA